TDSSFKTVPSLCSLLSGRIVPPEGGDTEFASTRRAYPNPPAQQRRGAGGGGGGGGSRFRLVPGSGAARLLHRQGARGVPARPPSHGARQSRERAEVAVPGRPRLPPRGEVDGRGPGASERRAGPRDPARVPLLPSVAGRGPRDLGQSPRPAPRDAPRHRAAP